MSLIERIRNWFDLSHRWYHFTGGVTIGLGSDDEYCAAYTGIGIASALEFKDHSYGGEWDWIDWGLTVSGVAIGFGIKLLIRRMTL
jgi:hypothetical protein